jgi:hypothetical protein
LAAYLGSTPTANRKAPPPSTASEDRLAHAAERRGLIDNARDLVRNFPPARSMLAKHLNYITEFNFQSLSNDEGWNRELERFVEWRSQAERFDARGIFDLQSFLRTAESEAVVTGDCGTAALDTGHVMPIEGDCIRSPIGDGGMLPGILPGVTELPGKDGLRCIHGVWVDDRGRPQRYSVWKRTYGGFVPDTEIPADHLHLLAYRDRFDQVRGIGLMASALDLLRDADEGIDAALLKSKLLNAFGVAIFSDGPGSILDQNKNAETSAPEFSLGKQVNMLNMRRGDDVKLLSAAHPSREFQDFMRVVLLLALQTLEIPYSFIDESFTNYSGARCAWLHYERACKPKRRRLIRLLNWITRFWLLHGIRERQITLPAGMGLGDAWLQASGVSDEPAYEWIPQGMPWWKPSEEIQGDLAAIAAGLTTFDRVTRERGTGNVADNIRANAAVMKLARREAFPLQLVPQGSAPANQHNPDDAAGPAVRDGAPQVEEAAA